MKRPHEDDVEVESCNDPVKDSDVSVMQAIRDKFENNNDALNQEISRQQQETCRKYYASYIQKCIEKLPIGKNILEAIRSDHLDCDHPEHFYKMFSAAKTVVHAEMQTKKLKAFNAVFEMVNGLMGKYVHENLVKPAISKHVSGDILDDAFRAYQAALSAEDSVTLELQCVAYLIQHELDQKRPLSIPHPMMNRFSQQMKAVSQYILGILTAVASPSSHRGNSEWSIHQQRPEILKKSGEKLIELNSPNNIPTVE